MEANYLAFQKYFRGFHMSLSYKNSIVIRPIITQNFGLWEKTTKLRIKGTWVSAKVIQYVLQDFYVTDLINFSERYFGGRYLELSGVNHKSKSLIHEEVTEIPVKKHTGGERSPTLPNSGQRTDSKFLSLGKGGDCFHCEYD